ncbi:MAG: hypothetical protein ACT4OS_10645 [Acidimicrobiales bacterium]
MGVPSVRDASYVDRLLAFFDFNGAELLRDSVDAGRVTREVDRVMRSLYDGELRELAAVSLADDAVDPDAPGNLARIPTGPFTYTRVSELRSFTRECIHARVDRSYLLFEAIYPEWVTMLQRPPDQDNPTGWVLVFDGFREDGQEPHNPCF